MLYLILINISLEIDISCPTDTQIAISIIPYRGAMSRQQMRHASKRELECSYEPNDESLNRNQHTHSTSDMIGVS